MLYYCCRGWAILIVFVYMLHIKRNSWVRGEKVCAQTVFPPEIRTEFTHKIDGFKPFRFRANNYGETQYTLQGFYNHHQIMNIKIKNSARPDTLSGGDLTGFYAFHKSFFVTQKINTGESNYNKSGSGSTVHSIDTERYALEMWNIYIRKNISMDKLAVDGTQTSDNLISINVLFKVGNKSLSRLNPLISALEKLRFSNSLSHQLPYNYDPYALLPRQSSFLIYSANAFPFPYPYSVKSLIPRGRKQTTNKNKSKIGMTETERNTTNKSEFGDNVNPTLPCKTSPSIKIYLYRTPLTISQAQLEKIEKVESQIRQKSSTNIRNKVQDQHPDYDGRFEIQPKIFETPSQELILLRRSVAPASAAIISFKINSKGDPDSEPYPPDCAFLHDVIPSVIQSRALNQGTHNQKRDTSVFYLTAVVIIRFRFY